VQCLSRRPALCKQGRLEGVPVLHATIDKPTSARFVRAEARSCICIMPQVMNNGQEMSEIRAVIRDDRSIVHTARYAPVELIVPPMSGPRAALIIGRHEVRLAHFQSSSPAGDSLSGRRASSNDSDTHSAGMFARWRAMLG
jgi:hypothetical protein